MANIEITEPVTVEKPAAPVADRAVLLASIATMETELARLKAALGVEGVIIPAAGKGKKSKKAKDPDAPKKEANAFIKFTVRVGNVFKAAIAAAKEAGDEERVKHLTHPAPLNKQYCSFLKDQRTTEVEKNGKSVTVPDYSAWEDSEILEAFESWTPPEVSKMEAAGKTKKQKKAAADSSASESGSVAEEAPKERKKRAPLTEEQKAERKRKMAEKKAAKAAAEKSAEAEASGSESEAEAEAPKPAPAAEAAKPKFALKKTAAAAAPKSYTLEELRDFAPFTHEGVEYGVNKRGDVVNDDGEFVGHYNTATKKLDKKAAKPADWDTVTASDE